MAASWRVAKSLNVLLKEINAKYPGRPTASDGSIGDASHSSRYSDHNPNPAGVVCARDFTEWVQDGVEMNDTLAEHLRASRDDRIKYVISDRRMFSSYATGTRKAWEWGSYSGSNPHTSHLHVSVRGDYDNERTWNFGQAPAPAPAPTHTHQAEEKVNWTLVRKGTKGQHARNVQGLLVAAGRAVKVDGDFGPASESALRDWQRRSGLTADGICGPNSYKRFLGL